jgi:glucokinase
LWSKFSPDGRLLSEGVQRLESDIAIGIDLGGTIVRVGAVNGEGKLLTVHQLPIEPEKGAKAGLIRIGSLIEKTLRDVPRANLLGIGIGATGPLDRDQGTIQNPYTLSTWENVPIVATLAENFKVPVILENDADASALGEYWAGAGQDSSRLAAITIGTGIGTALIIDGRIYRGLDGAHPEGGHHIIDPSGPQCYCGAKGCWESLVSGPAIARQAQYQPTRLASSQLFTLVGGEPSKIDARLVAEAALGGDEYALSIIETAAKYVSIGLINIIALFVPDTVVMSGGVMKSIGLFMPAIQQTIASHNIMVPASRVKVLPAKLGYHAGLIGAAYTIIKEMPS